MMNGHLDYHDPPNGYYTGNAPKYCNTYTSKFTSNTRNCYFPHSNSPSDDENIHLGNNIQSDTWNRNRTNVIDFHSQQQPCRLDIGKSDFENGKSSVSSSIAYYNRVYAQVRSNTPVSQDRNSSVPSTISKQSRPTSPFIINGNPQPDFFVKPTIPNRTSPKTKVNLHNT